MASNMKYIPLTKLWNLESWGIELGGLLAALSITVDSLADSYSNSAEIEALYGLYCALMKQKREFDSMYAEISNSAIKADNIPTE
jgi:hypothetical protein